MRMKSKPATEAVKAAREDVIAAIKKHGDALRADEILALLSHCVGQVIAMQDQRVMTREMALDIVSANIEAGNAEVIAGLSGAGGNA